MGFQLRRRTKGKNAWLNWSASNGNGLRGSVSAKVSKNITANLSSRGSRVTVNLGNGLKWVSSSKKPRVAKTPVQPRSKVSYSSYEFDEADLDYVAPPDEPFVFKEWIRNMDVISGLSSLAMMIFLYVLITLSGAILYSILAAFVFHWCVVGVSYHRSSKLDRDPSDLTIQLFAYPFMLPGILFFTPVGWSIILCTFLIFLFI